MLEYRCSFVLHSAKLGQSPGSQKMPKILPSQVASAIDSMFGAGRNELDSHAVAHTHRAEVHALLGLLDEVPSELVDLSSTDYLEFSRCRAVLSTSLALWNVVRHPAGARRRRQRCGRTHSSADETVP